MKILPEIKSVEDLNRIFKDNKLELTEIQFKRLKPFILRHARNHFEPHKEPFRQLKGEKERNAYSRDARKGLPEIYVDGERKYYSNVGQYLDGRKFNPGMLSDPAEKKKIREDELNMQTPISEDYTVYGSKRLNKPGYEDHHILFRALFSPFYKGRTEAEQAEITKFLVQNGAGIGNITANLQGVDRELHNVLQDSIHSWAQSNNIEVAAGDETWSNFKYDENGKLVEVSGTSDELVRARMPDLSHLPLPVLRLALADYVNLVQEPLVRKTAEMVNADELIGEIQGKGTARTVEEIEHEYYEGQKLAAWKSNILEDLDLPQDLFASHGTGKNRRPLHPFWYSEDLIEQLRQKKDTSKIKNLPGSNQVNALRRTEGGRLIERTLSGGAKIIPFINKAYYAEEIFKQGQSGSALDKTLHRTANYVPGLRANKETDIGYRTGKYLQGKFSDGVRSTLQMLGDLEKRRESISAHWRGLPDPEEDPLGTYLTGRGF